MKIHFREQYGSKGRETLYVNPNDQINVVRVPWKSTGGNKLKWSERFSIFRVFQRIFLPQGYPDSVSEDYIDYQKWDTVQAFCSTISGTLTTHAILKGVGVGSDAASALSATTTWIMKDGTGHFGKILFAWWKGSELDVDSKKWRIRADILNDLAMGIEIFVLPRYIDHAIYILCGTTCMKAIVGVAGGATRAALTQHHALRGNLADVASKDSAQETCVNLIASFLGLFLLTAIKSENILYSVFFVITFLHIYANLKAVKAVCLRTFNESRLLIALEEYFRNGKMLTPKEVNKLERVTVGQTVSVSQRIRIGVSAEVLLKQYKTTHDIDNILSYFDPNDKFFVAETKKCLGVYLGFEAKTHDILKGYFYAVSYLQDRTQIRDRYWEVQSKWNEFMTLSQNEGWNLTAHLLNVDEYRLEWKL